MKNHFLIFFMALVSLWALPMITLADYDHMMMGGENVSASAYPMGCHYYGLGWHWLGWLVVASVIVLLLIKFWQAPGYQDDAMKLLRARYVKGEINDDEFIRMKKALRD